MLIKKFRTDEDCKNPDVKNEPRNPLYWSGFVKGGIVLDIPTLKVILQTMPQILLKIASEHYKPDFHDGLSTLYPIAREKITNTPSKFELYQSLHTDKNSLYSNSKFEDIQNSCLSSLFDLNSTKDKKTREQVLNMVGTNKIDLIKTLGFVYAVFLKYDTDYDVEDSTLNETTGLPKDMDLPPNIQKSFEEENGKFNKVQEEDLLTMLSREFPEDEFIDVSDKDTTTTTTSSGVTTTTTTISSSAAQSPPPNKKSRDTPRTKR